MPTSIVYIYRNLAPDPQYILPKNVFFPTILGGIRRVEMRHSMICLIYDFDMAILAIIGLGHHWTLRGNEGRYKNAECN